MRGDGSDAVTSPATPVTPEPLPAFGERFPAIKKLAEGGMAELFLARDLSTTPPRLCVIKRILPALAKNPDYTKMFHDEGRIASLMTHPNIVRVFETVRSPSGPFLVMEFLAGQDLHDVAQRARRKGVYLPWDFALGLVLGAAEGIGYAHQLTGADGQPLNVVHRDLTPSNILVTWDGVVKVLDFGIAHAEHRLAKTRTGMVKGKAQYLAPEQITGQPLDGRVDQFALAVVLYQLLTGRSMFDKDNELACLHAILEGERPRVRAVRGDVPESVDQVIARATAVEPAQRFPSMEAFRDALSACVGAEVTRESIGARVRELFAGEFEAHAQLMGQLSSAGTDELRRLYEKARHAEANEVSRSARTVMMPEPHAVKGARRPIALSAVGAALLVAAGLGVALRPKKAPPAPTGSIVVRSEPPGASVVLDGRPTTWSTPVVLDQQPLGRHRIEVRHPDRKPFARDVSLAAEAASATVDVVLPPLSGSLRVVVDVPGARVTLDGQPLTLSGGVATVAELVAGEAHRVRAEAPGFLPREVEVRVGADEAAEVTLELQRLPEAPPQGEAAPTGG
ncbi:MAG: serine/threonine-protein kinase [Myxococcota bacterium]|jgi:serine/threonine-protein kinase